MGTYKIAKGAWALKIGKHEITRDGAPFIIAEIGANHNGDLNLAKKLIDAALEAGASCVKFQSWTKNTIFSREVYDNDKFLSDGRDETRTEDLEDVVEKYSLSKRELTELSAYASGKEIVFSCSGFSFDEVDFLVDDLKIPFIKIASMDIPNLPFLEYIGAKGVPVILSTGLASMEEIKEAVDTLTNAGVVDLALLHCIANYPPDDVDSNLLNIRMFEKNFPSVLIGFSDHSIGTAIPLAAIALGARVIEKHFTLNKDMEGWDHAISADQSDLLTIVSEGRRISAALGSKERKVTEKDLEMRVAFRRSIVASRFIKAGKVFERADIDFKRPGRGIPPNQLNTVIGRTAIRDIIADAIIEEDDFEKKS